MSKRRHFYKLPAALLNITPKPDTLTFFAQAIQSLCLRKGINLTSTFYESLKVKYVKVTKEPRSHETYVLILKLQEAFIGCLADLFISRLIYNILPFNY